MWRKLLNLFRDGQRDARALELPPVTDYKLMHAAIMRIKRNQAIGRAVDDERQVPLIKHIAERGGWAIRSRARLAYRQIVVE